MTRARVVRAAETLAETWRLDVDSQVAALRRDGFSETEAHRLIVFLPMAFSRPILEELGVTHFVPDVGAQEADGTNVTAKLMRQPEYAAALRLARAHRKKGVLDPQVFSLIAGSSSELNVASKALDQGADIVGATVASVLVDPAITRYLVR